MHRSRFFAAIIALAALSASSHVYSQTPGAEPRAPGSLVDLKLPSIYKNSQTPADQLQLNGDRTFSLQEAGQTYRGTFVVNGNTLELNISETNSKTSVTIQGNSLADSSGQTWVLREQPVGSESGAGVFRNQDVIRMAKADFDDAVIIAKIENSKCQFDTSPGALTHLKQSGVSAAVLKAMAETVIPPLATPTAASGGAVSTLPSAAQEPTKKTSEINKPSERLAALAYTAIDLGTLPGASYVDAQSINNSGQVVGACTMANGYKAFLYSGGTIIDLGTFPGGLSAGASGINDSGQIVGYSQIANGAHHAFLYNGGTIIDLGTLPGGSNSQAQGINNSGQVVGYSQIASGNQHAFLYSGGTMIDLGTLPRGSNSQARGINNSGQIVGSAYAANGAYHAFLYSSGAMTDLGTRPGGPNSQAQGINNSGHVVGMANRAFLYTRGTMIDLGTLGGSTSIADGINNSGQAVGSAETASGLHHAFLYNGGTMTDLNNLVTLPSGVFLTYASGINDHGQIAADGSNGHAYLLTPGKHALLDRTDDLGVESGYIAKNSTELEALKRLGERNYVEFTLLREDKQPKRVGDISLRLTSVDKKRNMYTLEVLADEKTVQKKDKEIYEPLQFYVAKTKQPYVLVVNEIGKDQVTGYLAAPKDASQKAVTPQSTVPEAVANAEVSNPPNAGQGVVHSGTFHIAEEGTWRVIYDLSGSYTVTPTDVLVTLETGSARTVHSVAAAPVLRSLRLEVCYQMSTDRQFDMFPGPFAGQELLLNDVSLKDGDVFKFPSSTFRIPRPTRTPVRNWLCSSLSGQRGNFYPAHDAGRPILIPSASIGTAEGLLHNEDVIKMVKAGFDDALIIEKVGNSKCQFDTSADAFAQLKQSGASGPVVRAVMEASAPRGLALTGRVVWNGLPVPNAKVRLAHRDSVSAPASASAVTANDGAFTIQDPPAGDLMIWVYAPSSEYEDLTGHAVTITAGNPKNIGNVSITKKLQLLSPTVSEIATTTPALEWAPFPDSVRYNVYVFNDSTRQRILLRSTKDTRMTVPAPLPNGQQLRWGVQAYNSKGEVIAVSWWRFTIGSGQPNETSAGSPPVSRIYTEIRLGRTKEAQRFGEIALKLVMTDPRRRVYSIEVLADDKLIIKKDKNINEIVQLYTTQGGHAPYNLIVNEITQDGIVGYLWRAPVGSSPTIEEGRLKIRAEQDTEANLSPSGRSTTAIPTGDAALTVPQVISGAAPKPVSAYISRNPPVYSSSDPNLRVPPNTTILDNFSGASVGQAFGVKYVQLPGAQSSERGASFSRKSDSRIEYPQGIPTEGTLEWWINVANGFAYHDFHLQAKQDQALIFSTDSHGGDVTWPGAAKLFVSASGDVSFFIAATRYNRPAVPPIEAKGTPFRFNSWHAIGVSYGGQGEFVMVDGRVVASAIAQTQRLGAAGSHQTPLDFPTIGETVSHYWAPHRYDGGFDGTVALFRASRAQNDWYLSRGVEPDFRQPDLSSVATPQTVRNSTCGGKEATFFISESTLKAIGDAAHAGNPDEVVRIARDAQLKVLSSEEGGHVSAYFITNPSNGCLVASRRTIKN